MKKISILLIALIILNTTFVAAKQGETNLPPNLEQYDYRILHNGNYIESNFHIENINKDSYLFPLRLILEKSGYQVSWNKGVISISKDDNINVLDLNKTNLKYKNISGSIIIENNFFDDFKDIELNIDEPTKTLIFKSLNFSNTDIIYYDLGPKTLKTSLNQDVHYNLNGGITNSSSKKPLVFLLHGSHHINNSNLNRYDLGFSYLMKYLSDDYFVVSINVNPNFVYDQGEPILNERLIKIFDETIDSLIKANNGEDIFDIDLKDKIDFSNSFLIGHSRGGQAVFELADLYKTSEKLSIKGLVSYAPSVVFEQDYKLADIPISIILPELDGDVTSLDGQSIFDEIMHLDNRVSPAQLVYLFGANHNSINPAVLYQDEGNAWFNGDKSKISSEDERKFIEKYTKEFLNNISNNRPVFENIEGVNGTLFGNRVLNSNYVNGEKIYSSENESLDKNIITKNSNHQLLISSYIPMNNTIGLFYHPGNPENLRLLKMNWENKNSSLTIKVDPKSDNSKYLDMFIAQDSTDKLNNHKNQSFTLKLRDKNNKEQIINIDDKTPNLLNMPGESIFDDTAFSNHTPLSLLRVPISEYELDKLREIEFLFSDTDSGSIILNFIQLN